MSYEHHVKETIDYTLIYKGIPNVTFWWDMQMHQERRTGSQNFLNYSIINSKKISLSTNEAEFVSLSEAVAMLLDKKIVIRFRSRQVVYEDNHSAVKAV